MKHLITIVLFAILLPGCIQPAKKPQPPAPGIPILRLQPVQTGMQWSWPKWMSAINTINAPYAIVPLGFDSRDIVTSNLPSKLTDANLKDFRADAKLRSENGLVAAYLVDSIEATGHESSDPNNPGPVVKGIVGMTLGTYGIALTPNASQSVMPHELGHLLNLSHAWTPDSCNDTPETTRTAYCIADPSNEMSYCPTRNRFSPCQIDRIRAAMFSLARSREITGLPVVAAAKIKSVVISDVPVICGE